MLVLLAIATVACGSGRAGRPVTVHPGSAASGGAIASQARLYTGTAYRPGGASPDGFDCSGFVQYLYGQAGIALPRTAEAQFGVGRALRVGDISAGDLVFFRTEGRRVSHVGIATGDGAFIHAPNARSRVRVDRLDASYWADHFAGARRMLDHRKQQEAGPCLPSFLCQDPPMPRAEIQRIEPRAVLPGGRLVVSGSGFDVQAGHVPQVTLGGQRCRLVRGSPRVLVVEVPAETPGGRQPLAIEGLEGSTPLVTVGAVLASGVHQVDSPAYDAKGRLYATLSGQRGQQTPVSVFRVEADGSREPFVTGLGNATSLAFGPDGHLYVSNRFEGTVARVSPDGDVSTFAEGLGSAFGLAFTREGDLLVGDRSGTIHRVDAHGSHVAVASLPPSVAAYHLAVAPDDTLIVSAPTLDSSDALYRVSPSGDVTRWLDGFGRPQGLAFDRQGVLHVVDALAGDSHVYRIESDDTRTALVSGAGLLGVAFDPTDGAMTVCTDDTIYRVQ